MFSLLVQLEEIGGGKSSHKSVRVAAAGSLTSWAYPPVTITPTSLGVIFFLYYFLRNNNDSDPYGETRCRRTGRRTWFFCLLSQICIKKLPRKENAFYVWNFETKKKEAGRGQVRKSKKKKDKKKSRD